MEWKEGNELKTSRQNTNQSQKYKPRENLLWAGRWLEQAQGKCCAQERDENSAGSGEGRHSSGQQLTQSPELTAPTYNKQGVFNAQPPPCTCQTTIKGSSGATNLPLLCPARLGQRSHSAPSVVTGQLMTQNPWTGLGKRVSDSTAQ